jgi:hypothetical protein
MTAKIETNEQEFTLFVDKGFWVGDKPKAQDILEQIHLNKTSIESCHILKWLKPFKRHCKI